MSNLIPRSKIWDIVADSKFRVTDEVRRFLDEIADIPTVDAIPKDQYETRLKADMVAMLTEIQVGIGEHIIPSNYTDSNEDGWSEGAEWCIDYIQEQINLLKADSEE